MSETCLMNLVVSPEVEDVMADWLLERDEVSGFSSVPIAGHGSSEHAMSLAEQVAGRRRQVLFLLHLKRADADALLDGIRGAFRGSGMHFWLTPVADSGHVE